MKMNVKFQQSGSSISHSDSLSSKDDQEQLLTLEQTAERLAVSLPTLRAWVWKKKIEVVRIGRCVRIREKIVQELISRNTCPADSPRQF